MACERQSVSEVRLAITYNVFRFHQDRTSLLSSPSILEHRIDSVVDLPVRWNLYVHTCEVYQTSPRRQMLPWFRQQWSATKSVTMLQRWTRPGEHKKITTESSHRRSYVCDVLWLRERAYDDAVPCLHVFAHLYTTP